MRPAARRTILGVKGTHAVVTAFTLACATAAGASAAASRPALPLPAVPAATLLPAVAATSSAEAGRPSSEGCVAAWNATSEPSARASIVRRHPSGASIGGAVPATGLGQKIGLEPLAIRASGCTISFVLPTGHTLSVWGLWKGGSVASWGSLNLSAKPVTVIENATIHANGTLTYTG